MKKNKIYSAIVILFVAICGVVGYSWHILNFVPAPQETLLFAPRNLIPKSKGSLRLLVRNHVNNTPIENANIKITLASKKEEIFLGATTTDKKGNADFSFDVPDIADGSYKLKVKTRSKIGEDTQIIPVLIKKDYKILLSTDKPLYQPGQTIHVRALIMDNFSLKPVSSKNAIIEIYDPKGNKVFKKKLGSFEYGIVACDFQLATEINQGRYRIKATCGKFSQEKTLTVKYYVLPKFKVEAHFSKNYYMPGELIKGHIDSHYFFGKPVANAKVEVEISTFDVNLRSLVSWKGKTAQNGKCDVAFQIPKKLYGNTLNKGNAKIAIDIKVTDGGNHSQEITHKVIISNEVLNIFAIADSLNVVPGIPNTLYLCTTYPDGTPARTDLNVNNSTIKTNSLGIAELQVIPSSEKHRLLVIANDNKGNRVTKQLDIFSKNNSDFITTLDRVSYKSGDIVSLKILSPDKRSNFYVDIIKNNQAIATYSVDKRELQFSLPQDIAGTLVINTYKTTDDLMKRDSHVIYVSPSNDLDIGVHLDKNIYKPGDTAKINFTTTSKKAALSIAIVDESVYALQEMQPGLEKVYFMLQKELLKPKYQIHYTSPISRKEIVDSKKEKVKDSEEKKQATKVMFAIAGGIEHYMQKNDSYAPKVARIQKKQKYYWKNLSLFGFSIPYVFLFIICAVALVSMLQKTIKKQSIYYNSSTPAQEIFRSFSFHYKMSMVIAFTMGLFLFLIDEINRNATFTIFVFSMITFVVLFSLNKNKKCNTFLLGSSAMLASTAIFFSLNNFHRHDAMETIITVYSIALVTSLLLTIINSVRYCFQKNRLSTSGFAVGLTTSFLITFAGCLLFSAIALEDYHFRRYIGRDNIQFLTIFSLFMGIPFLFLFATYLRSFLYKTSWKRVCLVPIFPIMVILFCIIPTQMDMATFKVQENALQDVRFVKKTNAFLSNGKQSQRKKVRIRKHFPETLYWNPRLITNEGKAKINVPVSDSITTFRMICQGVDKNGNLGSTTKKIKVFQDFFVDIDFPVSLTQNDIVTVPIQVYNYLESAEKVKLVLQKEDWFECVGESEKNLILESNQVIGSSFRIQAKQVGQRQLTVFAYGSKMNDAVQRSVSIEPDAKKIETVINGTLTKTVTHSCVIPKDAESEANKIIAKCYPGVAAVLIDGLEGLLRIPGG